MKKQVLAGTATNPPMVLLRFIASLSLRDGQIVKNYWARHLSLAPSFKNSFYEFWATQP